MRPVLTLLAYLASFAVVAVVAFFGVIFLAGPHGGALPLSMHMPVVVLGWALVVAAPALVARWVWRRLGGKVAPASAHLPP